MSLSRTGEVDFGAIDQNLGQERAGIVVRRHHEAIRAGAEDRETVARIERRELAILRKEVPTLTNGTHDIHRFDRSGGFRERNDFVPAFVKRGANEVVHRGVHNRESFGGCFLHILDGREERAGISDKEAAGLEKNAQAKGLEDRDDRRRVILGCDASAGLLGEPPIGRTAFQRLVIDNPDAAAEVEKLEPVLGVDLLHEISELLGRLGKGGGFEDLRTNVGLNATDFQMRQRRGDFVDLWRAVETDAELVFAFAGGDELVRLGIDIRIHPNGDWRLHTERTSDFVDALEFALALDIEGVNTLAERVGNFLAGLADTGKSAAIGAGTGFEHAEQLAA